MFDVARSVFRFTRTTLVLIGEAIADIRHVADRNCGTIHDTYRKVVKLFNCERARIERDVILETGQSVPFLPGELSLRP